MDHPFFCIALNPAFQEYVPIVINCLKFDAKHIHLLRCAKTPEHQEYD